MNKRFLSVVQTENVLKDYQIKWQIIQALGRNRILLKIARSVVAIACAPSSVSLRHVTGPSQIALA